MQARIIEQRQAEENGGTPTPTSTQGHAQHVDDDVMLTKLANEGWAEHVVTRTD
jgi:hypothetical protein